MQCCSLSMRCCSAIRSCATPSHGQRGSADSPYATEQLHRSIPNGVVLLHCTHLCRSVVRQMERRCSAVSCSAAPLYAQWRCSVICSGADPLYAQRSGTNPSYAQLSGDDVSYAAVQLAMLCCTPNRAEPICGTQRRRSVVCQWIGANPPHSTVQQVLTILQQNLPPPTNEAFSDRSGLLQRPPYPQTDNISSNRRGL